MDVDYIVNCFTNTGIDFYAGVPDSQLKPFCDYLQYHYTDKRHWITANEGSAVAAAAGHYLATGKCACVYMQNSGIGNAVNPICSLISPEVYNIPLLFVIGWRGEPGVKDEPQHVFQGKITPSILDLLDIPYMQVDRSTDKASFDDKFSVLSHNLKQGKSIAVIIKTNALSCDVQPEYKNDYTVNREIAINEIVEASEDGDIFVSSTGKMSRELYEIRDRKNNGHEKDFHTVGSMGHCSVIALKIAAEKPHRKVIVLDGDGAVLMHMGSVAMIGGKSPSNLIHIVLDNGAHETVGGMPTISTEIDFCGIATACRYKSARTIYSPEQIKPVLKKIKNADGPHFIRILTAHGARKDLGRPNNTPAENKVLFMKYLEE